MPHIYLFAEGILKILALTFKALNISDPVYIRSFAALHYQQVIQIMW